MEWLGLISSIISVITAIFAIAGWAQARRLKRELEGERQRQNQWITIKLQGGEDRYELPNKIRRADFERNEILGRLGMIPMIDQKKGTRFALDFLNSQDFLNQVETIRAGQGELLLSIPCKPEEFHQFNFKNAFPRSD